ncbi:hemicentin-1-like [Planococcus citri]|uniref:hemicentin-1-like n=1 Tax=Planococcus citri TaxID=170843 RepID=UPI0031F77E92
MRSFSIFCIFLIFYCNECTATEFSFPHFICEWSTNKSDESRMMRRHFSSCARTDLQGTSLNSDDEDQEISNSTATPTHDQKALYKLLHILERSPPYYAIYVITFATASCDEGLVEKILEQIQIKRSQVNFFIRGEYPSEVDYLKEYRLITSISNGITWTPSKLNPFTDCKSMRINFIPTKAHLLTVYGTDNGTYCMKTDSLLRNNLEDMIQSNFDSNEYDVTISRRHDRTMKGRTQEVCVEVRRKSQHSKHASFYSLRGFSESDFDFDYGFSQDNVTSLDDTYLRPVKGISNKIYVSPFFENTPYGFDHFKILFLNGTSSAEEIPLEPIPNTDLFVGSFEPPDKEYFYIQVTTYANGETISRMSHTAMNAADGFGKNKQNPTFIPKPTFVNQEYPESKYKSIAIMIWCVVIILLMLLFFTSPEYFWNCREVT